MWGDDGERGRLRSYGVTGRSGYIIDKACDELGEANNKGAQIGDARGKRWIGRGMSEDLAVGSVSIG
jgi:hypothetical protein